MPPIYGTLQVIDTLKAYNNQSVLQYGEDNLAAFLQMLLDAHNKLVTEMFSRFMGTPPDRLTTYGTNMSVPRMIDIDEFGLADAEKSPLAQDVVGFPLRRKQVVLQWTRDYLANTTPYQLAAQVLAIQDADILDIYASIRRALFTATNNTTYVDRLVDNATFTLKRLVNADGAILPPQPIGGTTFNGATHTHYLATASLTEADALALIETVREHGFVGGGKIVVAINKAQESAYRAFSGFSAYGDPRLVYSVTPSTPRADGAVDFVNLEDRAIGIHSAAEVQVKPWVPAGYMTAYIEGGVGMPTLGWRAFRGNNLGQITPAPQPALGSSSPTPAGPGPGDLRIVADLDRYPLHARASERLYGVSVWNRLGAAVLYIGGGAYVTPTFTT